MDTLIDTIIITNIPSFYKINLFNRIAEKKNILVIFTHKQSIDRNNDFYDEYKKFKFVFISDKSKFGKLVFIINFLKSNQYNQLIIGGWDQLIYTMAAIISPIKKNSVLIESSIFESKTNGLKGEIKKLFLSRISKAYVSGKSQIDLCIALGFKGELIKTKGVGVFNFIPQPKYKPGSTVKNFIYVGRLSPEKNLKYLVETFNRFGDLTLNIIGFGPQEAFLKSIANQNIIFHGAIANKDLFKLYLQNDVFILPSVSEPWGMVVEEAFNCGLPVIVSDKVGCAQEIVNSSNGIVFKLNEPDGLINAIIKILDIDYYNTLKLNVSKMDFEKVIEDQINCYLD